MNSQGIILAVEAGLKSLKFLLDTGRELYGESAIPSWDEMLIQWQKTQDKIDAEIGK